MPAHSTVLPRSLRSLRVLAIALTFGALGACEDEGTTTPPVIPPLGAGNWYMHSANGVDLPAEISRRFIGLVDEQTFLDSSRIEVFSTGTWEQRYYLRILHTGVLDRADVVSDEGTWAVIGNLNEFTSSLRPRTFEVGVADAFMFASDEPMVFFPGAPNVIGIYRTTKPAP